MEKATLILAYLEVVLSGPPLSAIVVLILVYKFAEDIRGLLLRIARIRLPGGAEVDTPQSRSTAEEDPATRPKVEEVPVQGVPSDLRPEQREAMERLVRSHIATAYLWEYRYLNYFLARGTQFVLDWLVQLPEAITYTQYDAFLLPRVPSAQERQAIINALQAHHLIQYDTSTGVIAITPKGQEYHEWRGPMPAPPLGSP